MSKPEFVEKYFDLKFEGYEHSVIDWSRPVASLREEIKLYFGKDFAVPTDAAHEILEEIKKHNYTTVKTKDTGDKYTGLWANDLMTLTAIFIEL